MRSCCCCCCGAGRRCRARQRLGWQLRQGGGLPSLYIQDASTGCGTPSCRRRARSQQNALALLCLPRRWHTHSTAARGSCCGWLDGLLALCGFRWPANRRGGEWCAVGGAHWVRGTWRSAVGNERGKGGRDGGRALPQRCLQAAAALACRFEQTAQWMRRRAGVHVVMAWQQRWACTSLSTAVRPVGAGRKVLHPAPIGCRPFERPGPGSTPLPIAPIRPRRQAAA